MLVDVNPDTPSNTEARANPDGITNPTVQENPDGPPTTDTVSFHVEPIIPVEVSESSTISSAGHIHVDMSYYEVNKISQSIGLFPF